jgi:hypothetical protein
VTVGLPEENAALTDNVEPVVRACKKVGSACSKAPSLQFEVSYARSEGVEGSALTQGPVVGIEVLVDRQKWLATPIVANPEGKANALGGPIGRHDDVRESASTAARFSALLVHRCVSSHIELAAERSRQSVRLWPAKIDRDESLGTSLQLTGQRRSRPINYAPHLMGSVSTRSHPPRRSPPAVVGVLTSITSGALLIATLFLHWSSHGTGSVISGRRLADLMLRDDPRPTEELLGAVALYSVAAIGAVTISISALPGRIVACLRLALIVIVSLTACVAWIKYQWGPSRWGLAVYSLIAAMLLGVLGSVISARGSRDQPI